LYAACATLTPHHPPSLYPCRYPSDLLAVHQLPCGEEEEDEDEEEDDGEESEDGSGKSRGSTDPGDDPDLTHTRALAAALGLLQDDAAAATADRRVLESEDIDMGRYRDNIARNAAPISSSSSLAERLGNLHSSINTNNASQQMLLAQLLQQQASVSLSVSRGSSSSALMSTRTGHLLQNERIELENAHRARELETRMEMLELLDLALSAGGGNSGEGRGGREAEDARNALRLRRSLLDNEDEYLPGASSPLQASQSQQRGRQALLHSAPGGIGTITGPGSTPGLTGGIGTITGPGSTPGLTGGIGTITGPGSTPGLSNSSAESIRRALSSAAGTCTYPMPMPTSSNINNNDGSSGHRPTSGITSGTCVDQWNVDLSSPFVEYSPDTKAVLNRSGLHSVSSSMLALSPIYSKGAKVTMSVSIEYLKELERTPGTPASVAAANAVLPPYLRTVENAAGTNPSNTGSSNSSRINDDDGHTFSFGLSVLDAMPPMGTQCFGKEAFTWGAYDHRRSSAFSQSATIGSSGILAGVCAAFEEGDTLSLVLDLDPNSVTVLAPADRRPMQAGSSSKRDGKGCAHFLVNGSIIHTFPQLDVEKRYVMGVTLCTNNCVRLFSRNVCLDRMPEAGRRGSGVAAVNIMQPMTPQIRAEMPAEMTHPHPTYLASNVQEDHDDDVTNLVNRDNSSGSGGIDFDESDVMDMLNSMHDSITAAASQTQAALYSHDNDNGHDNDNDNGNGSMATSGGFSASVPNSPHASLRYAESLNLTALGSGSPTARMEGAGNGRADYGTNDYGGGTFVREWGRTGSSGLGPAGQRDGDDGAQPSSASSSVLLSTSVPVSPTRNRNPQLSRPASPPRPSPASMRLGQRFSSHPATLAAQMLTSSNAEMQNIISSRAAMAQANNIGGGADMPIPNRALQLQHPPDYSLITPTNTNNGNTGFSSSATTWREQQDQRARHQLALRAQLESQQERERARQQLIRDSDRGDQASLRSESKDSARGSDASSSAGGSGNGSKAAEATGSADAKMTISSVDHKADDKTAATSPKGDGDTGGMCCCCWELPKSVVLLPCRHMCVCEMCGLDEVTLPKCPMCRESIAQRFKVFT